MNSKLWKLIKQKYGVWMLFINQWIELWAWILPINEWIVSDAWTSMTVTAQASIVDM